jgi:hypothetical protein
MKNLVKLYKLLKFSLSFENEFKKNSRIIKENYWANVFNSTISKSNWAADITFSPGRWAVRLSDVLCSIQNT